MSQLARPRGWGMLTSSSNDAAVQSIHPTLRRVGPKECALAIAIPLIREEFLDDLARPGDKDLVHHFRRQRGLQKAAPEFCWEVYVRDEAAFAETVCTEVER